MARKAVRRITHGDSAGRRGGLQSRGGVHCVAGEEAATGGGVDVGPHQRLSCVDAAACLQRLAVGPLHALEGLEDAQAGPDCSLGVVLVDCGHAEHADYGVTNELLDGAAVGLDRLAAEVVVLA